VASRVNLLEYPIHSNIILTGASRLIEAEISYGTTLLRTHVEVDTIVGLISLEAIIPLRQRYASAITIQICVFAQEGITNMPGQMELMRKALALGCDCVGSAPYVDPQPENNIAAIFDLAKEFNLPVDFHLVYTDTQHKYQFSAVIGDKCMLTGLSP
jgi:cytosine deaminase